MPSKIVRLIKGGNVVHTIELYLETGPAARPQVVKKKEVNGKIQDFVIKPKETGGSCGQYMQKLEFDEFENRDLEAFVDYGSWKRPIDKLRFYVDDADIETREHLDAKNNCQYRGTKLFVWCLLIIVACGIPAIIQFSTDEQVVAIIILLFLLACLISWLWNCWCCIKSWNYAELDLSVDEFDGYRDTTTVTQMNNYNNNSNEYDDDVR